MNRGVIFFMLSVFLITSCEVRKKDKPLIVCTTRIIAEPLEQILGDQFQVHSLMGNGVDPHSFKPGLRDLEWLETADIIVMNGAHLEGKMAEVFSEYAKEKTVLSMLDGSPDSLHIKLDDGSNMIDPHFWFDPTMWKMGLDYVSTQIISQFNNLDTVSVFINKIKYLNSLDSLILSVQERTNQIPQERRVIVTTHDAFHYFGRAFGFEVYALQGVSTILEPGLKDMNELVTLVSTRKIPSVFVESYLSSKSIESLISGCKARGHNVQLGGNLYADCPGQIGTYEGTYLGMIDANINQLYKTLK